MEKLHAKTLLGTPFSLTAETVKNSPNEWDSLKISVSREGVLIGAYLRNYHSYGILTFSPFQQGDTWYALYSADYTTVRVMKLHSDRIEDWCGVARHGHLESYPIEIYVPSVSSIFCNFAFVSVCDPTDPEQWFIQTIDLSETESKKVALSAEHGDHCQPTSLTLGDCIDMSEWSQASPFVKMITTSYISINYD
jgi:hypothetical protein